MKKCHGCHQEIDKYAIACEYCGKLNEGREKKEGGQAKPDEKKNDHQDEK